MPRATLAGHPLHPQLIVAPAGLLPFSFVMDLLYKITGKKSYADAAYYGMVGGFVGGAIAGAAGAADYLAIPSDTKAKKAANVHAALNVGLLGLTAINLLLRRRPGSAGDSLPVLLSLLGTAGVLVSGWYGGHMVYEHGVRVKGVDPTTGAAELKLPGDRKIERGGKLLEEFAPGTGPEA